MLIFAVAVCALAGGGMVADGQPVAVYNGSFEVAHAADAGAPDGWQRLAGGPVRADAASAHEGKRSLMLSSTGERQEVMTATTFAFEPGMKLELAVWSEAEAVAKPARVVVYWFDQSVRHVGSQVCELPIQAQGWTQTRCALTPPGGAARLGFHCELLGAGTVRIDELRVLQTSGTSERETPMARVQTPAAQAATKAVYVPVDLLKAATRSFTDQHDGDGAGGWTDQGDNDLRRFPRGRQEFLGVPFEILDDQYGAKSVVMLGDRRGFGNEARIENVPQRFDVLHVLHAAAWLNDGQVGSYVLEYADGGEAAFDVIASRHVADWWHPVDLPEAKVAWYGGNAIRDLVGVWLLSWPNPHPEKEVRAIVLRSTGVVLGICGITTQRGGPMPGAEGSSLQAAISPDGVVVRRGEPLTAAATINHGDQAARQVRCRVALYRGSRSETPLHVLERELSIEPGQVGRIEYCIEALDVEPGSYRLVCEAASGQERAEVSTPVGVMPAEFEGAKVSATDSWGYGMMYVGEPDEAAFRRIREGGFDWVALDIQWAAIEPSPGVYDWSLVDRFIERAKRAGLKVEIKTLLFLGVPWLTEDITDGRNPSNFSDEFVARYTLLWQNLVQRYQDEPTVFAWCPTICHQDNPVGFIASDRTPALHRAWRDYLFARGWTLEAVSQRLGRQVGDWSEIEAPDVAYVGEHGVDDYFLAFMKMRKERAVEVYSQLCRTIRRFDATRPIFLKMGMPWPLDVWDSPSGLWPAGWLRMCRTYDAVLMHSNFEDSVMAAILPSMAEGYGVRMMVEEGKVPPNAPCTVGAVGQAGWYGAMGMEFCFWPTGQDLSDWSRLKPTAQRMQAFSRSYDNLWVTFFDDALFAHEKNWERIRRYYIKGYDLLTKLGLQYRVVGSDRLAAMPRDGVLLEANCVRLDDVTRERLDRFVRGGGTLVGQFMTDSEADFKLYNDWGVAMVRHAAGQVVLEGGLSFPAADGFVPTGKDLRVLMRWEDGRPAAVEKKVGEGRLIVFGCGFENDVAASAAVLRRLLEAVGVRPRVRVEPYGSVQVSVKRRDGTLQIGLINRDPMAKDVTVELAGVSPREHRAYDWLDGVDVPLKDSGGQAAITMRVEPSEIRLIEVDAK